MAAPPLPTNYVGADANAVVDHAGMHNDVNAAVNAAVALLALRTVFPLVRVR